MININGVEVLTLQQLEEVIALESEETKDYFRREFNNENISVTLDPTKDLKIYDFILQKSFNTQEPPIDFDFITGLNIKLHRKSILVKGECIREEYYQNFDGTTYSNLIVKEESTYTRDALGFPTYKTVLLTWYRKDGTPHPTTKTWVKFYSNLEKIAEGKTRRGNLVDNLQMPCIGLISIALTGSPNATPAVILEGRAFLADYKIEFDNFVEASNRNIVSCFSDSSNPKYASSTKYSWIDAMTPYGVTIRQYLISELTI